MVKLPFVYVIWQKSASAAIPCAMVSSNNDPRWRDFAGSPDEVGLVGLWFEAEIFCQHPAVERNARPRPFWLRPSAGWTSAPARARLPATAAPSPGQGFQQSVENPADNPYGQIITYGDIARQLAAQQGGRISAQAVGRAVGRNKVSIVFPATAWWAPTEADRYAEALIKSRNAGTGTRG